MVSKILPVAAAAVVAVAVAGAWPGFASADNSNTNTNDNDIANIGDPSNMVGPSDNNASWPPSGFGDGGGGSGGAPATPIVMPTP